MLLGTCEKELVYGTWDQAPRIVSWYTRAEDVPAFWTYPWLVVPRHFVEDDAGLRSFVPANWQWTPGRLLGGHVWRPFASVFASATSYGIAVPPPSEAVDVSISEIRLVQLLAGEDRALAQWTLMHLSRYVKRRRRAA
jgi:hypothetical protein